MSHDSAPEPAKDALARALSLLESTMESTADGIMVADGIGGIVRSNAKFREMWRIPDEIVASRDDEAALKFVLNQLKDPDAFISTVRALYSAHEDVSFDTLEFKDGRVVERYSQPQRIGNDVVGRVWSFRDITERTRTETALRESEERYRSLVELSPEAVIVHADGKLVYANNAAARMVGAADPQEMIGRSIGSFVRPDYWDRVKDRVRRVQEQGQAAPLTDLVLRRLDGQDINVETAAVPITIAGKVASLGVIRDVTERRRAEDEKARLEGQLLQAQKLESVGRLAGGVAHDFNNMLGVILGHTEFALEQVAPTTPLYADLLAIRNAATRSADLVRQLLAFARRQTVVSRVTSLNDVVSSTLQMLERMIGEEIELRWRPETALWPVHVDPSQIAQILANLCVNARDAISGLGAITIETGNTTLSQTDCGHLPSLVPGDYVRLTVRDNGCGMDQETQAKIFEPFFTTKGIGEGTGLGLATVYGAVRQMNGAIQVASTPGSGATFTIYLPRHAGAVEQAPKESLPGPSLRGRETVLLVEDEAGILKLTTTMLERQGYNVLAAARPGQALKMAMEYVGQIHLLITDVVMPEMNGRSLARTLSSLYPDMKRLFMSGYAADVVANLGILDEGVNFLQKPFTIEGLASKVREAIDGE